MDMLKRKPRIMAKPEENLPHKFASRNCLLTGMRIVKNYAKRLCKVMKAADHAINY